MQAAGMPYAQGGDSMRGHDMVRQDLTPADSLVSPELTFQPSPPSVPCKSERTVSPQGSETAANLPISKSGSVLAEAAESAIQGSCEHERDCSYPYHTDDRYAGGWLSDAGQLCMRRHGVNSMPSGESSVIFYLMVYMLAVMQNATADFASARCWCYQESDIAFPIARKSGLAGGQLRSSCIDICLGAVLSLHQVLAPTKPCAECLAKLPPQPSKFPIAWAYHHVMSLCLPHGACVNAFVKHFIVCHVPAMAMREC